MKRNQLIFVAVVTFVTPTSTTEAYRWSTSPVVRDDPYTGDPLNYVPCITTVPTIDGKVGLALWGNKSQSSLTDLVISARAFPFLMDDYRMRDANIEFFLLSANDYGSVTEKSIFKGVVDSIKKQKDRFHIKISNYLAELDRPANTRVFPDNVENSSIVGEVVPFTIGNALACPLVAVKPHNDDFVGCDENIMSYDLVFDNGDVFLPADWNHVKHNHIDALPLAVDLVHLNSPDYGVITADIQGAEGLYDLNFYNDWLQGRQISDPVPWSGGNPKGWTTYAGGGGTVYESPSTGFCVINTRNQTSAYSVRVSCTHNGQTLKKGRKYRVTVKHRYWGDFATSGSIGLELRVGTSSPRVGELPAPDETTAWRTTDHEFVAPETGTFSFQAPADYVDEAVHQGVGEVVIRQVAGTNNLTNFCHNLMVVRGGIDTTKINWGSFQAVQDENNFFSIGYFSDKAVNIQTILDEVNRTFNSWIIDNGDGKITMGTLKDPESLTPVFTIDNNNKAGREKRELDPAKGLTDSLFCRKNHFVFDRDRIAAGVAFRQVERAVKEYRRNVRYKPEAPAPIHETYAHALEAAGMPTLLQDTKYAQHLINNWCSLYTKERFFIEVPVSLKAENVTYLNYGDGIMYDGKKHILVGKKYQFATNKITLKLWR